MVGRDAYLFPKLVLKNVIFHVFDITSSIIVRNRYFQIFEYVKIVPANCKLHYVYNLNLSPKNEMFKKKSKISFWDWFI